MWKYNQTPGINELYHHGIKGQKWGVRRYQNEDGTRIKTSGTSTLKKYHSLFSEELKNFFKYEINPIGKLIYAVGQIKYIDGTNYINKQGAPEKLSKLKKKTTNMSIEEDIKLVNPGRGHKGSVMNCAYCSVALEMRRRGYDVIARKSSHGLTLSYIESMFKGAKFNVPNCIRNKGESRKEYVNRAYTNLCKEIESLGENARGGVGVKFEKGGAHMMFFENSKKGVHIYDPQAGTDNTDKIFSLGIPSEYSYSRFDNCKALDKITSLVMSSPENNKKGG